MKPIELRIKGLNSFEDEQRIDFTQLMTAGIFGIFGPTGSGKSSIFDAMTMALYGQMSRHGGQNLKECVNAACGEMSVWFKFEIFGEVYVAERGYVLKKDKLEPKITRLYRIEDGGNVPVTDKASQMTGAVTELIGLNYDDFSRSVILPQGKFSEFLLLDNKPKRNMLERIFNLEEFGERLNRLIADNSRDTQNALKLIAARLERYEGVSAERLKELIAAAESAETKLAEQKKQREELDLQVRRLTEIKRLSDEQSGFFKRREQELAEAERHGRRKERLSIAERAAAVRPLMTERDTAAGKYTELEKSYEGKCAELEALEKTEQRASFAFDAAQSRKDTEYPDLIAKEANLAQAAALTAERNTLAAERNMLLGKYKKLVDELNKTNKSKQELERRQDEAKQFLSGIAARRATLIGAGRREIITQAHGLWKQNKELNARIEKEAAKLGTVNKRIGEQRREADDFGRLLESAVELARLAEAKLKEAQTRSMAAVLAADLRSGEPCPVCGSTQHISIAAADDDLHSLEQESGKKRSEADRLRVKAAELGVKLNKDTAAAAELSLELDELMTRASVQSAELKRLTAELGSADLELQYSKIAEDERERERLDADERILRTEADKIQTEQTKAADDAAALDRDITAVTVSGTEKAAELARLGTLIERLGLTPEADPSELLQKTRTAAAEITNGFELAKKELDGLRGQKQKAANERSELNARLTAAREQADSLGAKLKDALLASGLSDEDSAQSAWLEPEAAAALDAEIKLYERQAQETDGALRRLQAELQKFEGEMGVLPDDPGHMLRCRQDELNTLSGEIELSIGRSRALRDEAQRMAAGLDDAARLTAEHKKYAHRADMLTELSKLFAGNKFVEFIAKRQMEYITVEASRRLKQMSGGHYAMELSSADFIIRDDSRGGIRRSPKTLSGGETFMASLCLALALSAKIQLKRRSPLEFFFLDEGFGSLDNSLLDSVMTALEELRQEKLTVGIISHVDELKNRVPRKLLVSPAQPGICGTTVKIE